MTAKTKTIKKNSKKTNKAFQVGTRENVVLASVPYTAEDFKNSLLIVSLLVNAFVFTTWITVQVSSDFASTAAYLVLG